MNPKFEESNFVKFAEDDPTFDPEEEVARLKEKYDYEEPSTENKLLLEYMIDRRLLGDDLANDLNEIIVYSHKDSVKFRLREIELYMRELEHGTPTE